MTSPHTRPSEPFDRVMGVLCAVAIYFAVILFLLSR